MLISPYIKSGLKVTSLFLILTLISVYTIDRPLALWIHSVHLDQIYILKNITEHGSLAIEIIYLLILVMIPIKPQFGNRFIVIVYLVSLVIITLWIKTKLKILFGRDWPNTWSGSHQSLIVDNVYRFNYLQSSNWSGSFPSGHTTLASVTSISMYILYQKYKYLWFSIIAIFLTSLVLLNYHFLGDCFAGIALGSLCAYFGMALFCDVHNKFNINR